VKFWLTQFGVNEQELLTAIRSVGHLAIDVGQFLSRKK
jgi:hypothetical protein